MHFIQLNYKTISVSNSPPRWFSVAYVITILFQKFQLNNNKDKMYINKYSMKCFNSKFDTRQEKV